MAAKYGIKKLVSVRPMDEGFLFFTIGILASLRAVQSALLNRDIKQSAQHKVAIEAWKKNTPMDGPEITFIKTSRDLILKEAFQAFAARSHGGIGEGANYKVTSRGYDVVYYVGKERRDLVKDMLAAVKWLDQELTALETQLPPSYLPRRSKASRGGSKG